MIQLLLGVLGYIAAKLLNAADRALFYILYILKGKSFIVHDLRAIGTDRYSVKAKEVESAAAVEGETKPFRNADFGMDRLVTTPIEGITTLDSMFKRCVQSTPHSRCMASRPVLDMGYEEREMPDGSRKKWEIPTLGEYQWHNFGQVDARIDHVLSGLVQFAKLKSLDKMAIFEETCEEWMITAHACFRQNITVVTVYATLGDDALVVALNETEITTMFTNENQLEKLKSLAKRIPSLKYIVFKKTPLRSQYSNDSALQEYFKETGVRILSFDDLEKLGATSAVKDHNKTADVPATPESLALIMYTSGTTGDPKGVMMTHSNVMASIGGVGVGLGTDTSVAVVYIGYLPLAHILELVAENYVLSIGGSIAYGNPRTLTDKGCRFVGDLVAAAPNVMTGVPRVWDTVKKAAFEKISNAPPLNRWMFHTAYAARKEAMKNGFDTPLWNALVFQKMRAVIGGHIKLVLSGGAPMNAESQEFLRIALGCVVVQGYGLTETCAGLSVQNGYHEFATRRVGPPIPSCEVKLVDVREMGYTVHDKPYPRGEIVVRGPVVTRGYYKRPELTAEVYGKDGWFYTGDIGQINEDGSLSVVDRKKNLVKLAHGEYVALERLESIYGNSPFVSPNGICIVADSLQNYVVALVLPQPTYAEQWAKKNGIAHTSLADLCANPKFKNAVLQQLQEEAKRAKLKSFEVVKDIRILPDEWTPQNGMLTAAMKLLRRDIAKKYATEIAEMYS